MKCELLSAPPSLCPHINYQTSNSTVIGNHFVAEAFVTSGATLLENNANETVSACLDAYRLGVCSIGFRKCVDDGGIMEIPICKSVR